MLLNRNLQSGPRAQNALMAADITGNTQTNNPIGEVALRDPGVGLAVMDYHDACREIRAATMEHRPQPQSSTLAADPAAFYPSSAGPSQTNSTCALLPPGPDAPRLDRPRIVSRTLVWWKSSKKPETAVQLARSHR